MTSFSMIRESIFIVLLGLASISFISLVSYDISDPGFSTTGSSDGVNNYIGLFGAYFSSFLFSFFGIASYFLPVLFLSAGVTLIKTSVNKIDKSLVIIRVFSFLMLLLSSSTLFSIHIGINSFPEGSGGVSGLLISAWFIQKLGLTGSTVLLMALILSFLPLMVGFSYIKVADFIGTFLLLLMKKIFDLVSKFSSTMKEKQNERIKKKAEKPIKEIKEPIKKPLKEKVVNRLK